MEITEGGAGPSLGQELCILEEKVGPLLSMAMQKVKKLVAEHEVDRAEQSRMEELLEELEGMKWLEKRYRELSFLRWDSEEVSEAYFRAKAERGEHGGEGTGPWVRGIEPL